MFYLYLSLITLIKGILKYLKKIYSLRNDKLTTFIVKILKNSLKIFLKMNKISKI